MIETSPQTAELELGVPQELQEINISEREQIASQIRERLQPIAGVESAWLEDLGRTINVYIATNNVRNATLYPVFDAQYDIESEYEHISFHFLVNHVDPEHIQTSDQIRRLF